MAYTYEEIELEVVFGTEGALLLTDGDEEQWIPLSTINDAEYFTHYEKGQVYNFEIADFILKDKGLI